MVMYSRERQCRRAHPTGIGEPIVNIQPRGPMGMVVTAPRSSRNERVMMKEVYMYSGIDGTGPYDKDDYKDTFENSFVKEFTQHGCYLDGPGAMGGFTHISSKVLYKFIKKEFLLHYENGSYLKIMLAGYSRGAVAVCAVAKLLGEDSIPVHGLFLCDPVDRDVSFWGKDKIIPKNVSHVVRTQRYTSVSSRESFGTTCTEYWNKENVRTKFFRTTHGGMGGCPWGKDHEAKYYKFSFVSKQINSFLQDGYYKKPIPPGAMLDDTKPPLIQENFPDGITTVNAVEEEAGHQAARGYFRKKTVEIAGKKASLLKLSLFEDALAQKKRNEATLKDYYYKKNTGQGWVIGRKV